MRVHVVGNIILAEELLELLAEPVVIDPEDGLEEAQQGADLAVARAVAVPVVKAALQGTTTGPARALIEGAPEEIRALGSLLYEDVAVRRASAADGWAADSFKNALEHLLGVEPSEVPADPRERWGLIVSALDAYRQLRREMVEAGEGFDPLDADDARTALNHIRAKDMARRGAPDPHLAAAENECSARKDIDRLACATLAEALGVEPEPDLSINAYGYAKRAAAEIERLREKLCTEKETTRKIARLVGMDLVQKHGTVPAAVDAVICDRARYMVELNGAEALMRDLAGLLGLAGTARPVEIVDAVRERLGTAPAGATVMGPLSDAAERLILAFDYGSAAPDGGWPNNVVAEILDLGLLDNGALTAVGRMVAGHLRREELADLTPSEVGALVWILSEQEPSEPVDPSSALRSLAKKGLFDSEGGLTKRGLALAKMIRDGDA